MRVEETHLTRKDFDRLMALDLEVADRAAILHGIAICRKCRPVAGRLFELLERGDLTAEFSIVELALAESRLEAPALFQELSEAEDRRHRVKTTRYRSWGLCELLIRASLEVEAAETRLEFALLAVEVSRRLEEDQPCEQAWLNQLRGLAKACLADAERRLGGSAAARGSYEEARRLWQWGEEDAGDALDYGPIMAKLQTDWEDAEEAAAGSAGAEEVATGGGGR